MRIVIIILLLFISHSNKVLGWQNISQQYTSKNFNAHPLIWNFAQDEKGRLWMANNDGVLRFDGSNWHLYETPKPVRSIVFDKHGNLFLACEGDMAVFTFDKKGEAKYTSFKDKIGSISLKTFADIQVFKLLDIVYFIAEKHLIKVENQADKFDVSVVDIEKNSGAFIFNDKIYLNEIMNGIALLNSGRKVKYINTGEKINNKIIGTIIHNNQLIVATNFDGLFFFNGQKLTPIKNDFALKGLASISQSRNGKIALGTFNDGVKIFDKQMHEERTISLPSNEIYSLFFDDENNLWVAHRKGLTHVNLSMPVKYFNELDIAGSATDMQLLGRNLYIATTNGLYKTNADNPTLLSQVTGVNGECWDLLVNGSSMLVASTNGLFEVTNNTSTCIIPNETFVHLQKGESDVKNNFYAFSANACFIIKYENSVFKNVGKVDGVNELANSIMESTDAKPWLGTYHNGLLQLNEKTENTLAPELSDGEVIIRYHNKVFFQTKAGIYTLDGNTFVKDEGLTKLFIDTRNMDYYFGSKNFWVYTNKELRQIVDDKIVEQSNAYLISGKPTALCIDGDKIWIAFEDKFYLVEQTINNRNNLSASINQIVNTSGKIIFDAQVSSQNYVPEIMNNENNFVIKFGMNSFINPAKNYYRYNINGLNTTWSEWQNEGTINLTKLPAGTYSIELEAKNALGQMANKTSFTFIVLAAWYNSPVAYMVYACLGLLCIFIIVKINNRALIAKNKNLETIVKERTQKIENQNTELTVEKKKSDDLLLNILPAEVAEELKQKGFADARQFDNVTLMFTDFVNFTGICESLSPQQIVNELDEYFKGFDKIIESNGIEKIKTIGDAYLAVCGIPNDEKDHAKKMAFAAIEIIAFVKKRKTENGLFDIRVGLHSGTVVAGIVGSKKFAYDIWGDTVNTASRIESSGQANKINISETTYQKIKNDFTCVHRGKINAKGKGEIDMYFVE